MHLTPLVSCLGQFLGGHIHEYKSFDPHAGSVCVIRCGVRGVLAADHSDPARADHARDVRSPDGRWLSRETLWASRSFDLSHSGGSRCAGLFDDSGGFILGFAPMAFVVGLVSEKLGHTFKPMLAATLAGTAVCYVMGIGWFMFLTGTGMWSAMVMCMFPFLPGDLAKIILASFLVAKYRKTLIERD